MVRDELRRRTLIDRVWVSDREISCRRAVFVEHDDAYHQENLRFLFSAEERHKACGFDSPLLKMLKKQDDGNVTWIC